MQLEIIGSKIYTEQDFHNQISKIFSIQDYYGNNLDALWDLLSTKCRTTDYFGMERCYVLKKSIRKYIY